MIDHTALPALPIKPYNCCSAQVQGIARFLLVISHGYLTEDRH
jgi:hypothetical protein